jgi:hypothetical protein
MRYVGSFEIGQYVDGIDPDNTHGFSNWELPRQETHGLYP